MMKSKKIIFVLLAGFFLIMAVLYYLLNIYGGSFYKTYLSNKSTEVILLSKDLKDVSNDWSEKSDSNYSKKYSGATSSSFQSVDLVRKFNKKTEGVLKEFISISKSEKQTVVLGQNIGHASEGVSLLKNNYQNYFGVLSVETNKIPKIVGLDYDLNNGASYLDVNRILEEHSNLGGIVEISAHMPNPFSLKDVRNVSLDGYKFNDLFEDGKKPNINLNKNLETICAGLSQLKDNGVVVLFRPYHEMNGDWFWWSYGDTGRISSDEFKKLWIYTFNYINNRGLNNVLFVYSPNASMWENGVKDTDYYYPGDSYVDLVSMDYYHDDLSQFNNHGNYDRLVALNKPFGLLEFGPESKTGFDNKVIFSQIKSNFKKINFIMYWHGWGSISHTNRAIIENANYKDFILDPSIVTISGR